MIFFFAFFPHTLRTPSPLLRFFSFFFFFKGKRDILLLRLKGMPTAVTTVEAPEVAAFVCRACILPRIKGVRPPLRWPAMGRAGHGKPRRFTAAGLNPGVRKYGKHVHDLLRTHITGTTCTSRSSKNSVSFFIFIVG